MAFEGLSAKLQEVTRKLRGKARITESEFKRNVKRGKTGIIRGRCQLCNS